MPPGPASRNQVRLQPDEKKSDFRLKMIPTGEITGVVTDSSGEPVEGANVTAEGGAGQSGGTTDEKGQFRIGGLGPGKYRVRAGRANLQLPPEIRTDGTIDLHYADTYYPGVLTSKEAARVEVRPDGNSSGVDIQLKPVPWVRVSGKVVGKNRSSGQMFVTVSKGSQIGGQGTIVKPDGTFVLWRLGPGKYRLSAAWSAPGGEYLQSASTAIDVAGSNIDNIELRLMPPFELTGQLQYENEQAKEMPAPPTRPGLPPGAPQNTNAPRPRRTILLLDAGNGMQQVNGAQVSDDDTFHIDRVTPGRYLVRLSWNTAYVKSMQLGPTVLNGAADLSNGTGGAALTLMLAAASGSVSGTVKDDAGNVQGTRVALTLEDEEARAGFATRSSIAKADGAYSFPNLPPGRYKVVAVSENDTDLAMQRSGLDEYEDQMETVEIQSDEKIALDLRRRTPGNR